MPKAEICYYKTSILCIGGGCPDSEIFAPACAVYIPDEKLLFRLGVEFNFIIGPPNTNIYPRPIILSGDPATTAYTSLLKQLGNIKPRERDVSLEFVTWLRAVEAANNIPKELSDILKNC